MVKIVSDGPMASKEVTCSKCTFKLEYTGEDVKIQSYYGVDSDPYSYIECPRCREHVRVPSWRLR